MLRCIGIEGVGLDHVHALRHAGPSAPLLRRRNRSPSGPVVTVPTRRPPACSQRGARPATSALASFDRDAGLTASY